MIIPADYLFHYYISEGGSENKIEVTPHIPSEMWSYIIDFLPPASTLSLIQVNTCLNKMWKKKIDQNLYWRNQISREQFTAELPEDISNIFYSNRYKGLKVEQKKIETQNYIENTIATLPSEMEASGIYCTATNLYFGCKGGLLRWQKLGNEKEGGEIQCDPHFFLDNFALREHGEEIYISFPYILQIINLESKKIVHSVRHNYEEFSFEVSKNYIFIIQHTNGVQEISVYSKKTGEFQSKLDYSKICSPEGRNSYITTFDIDETKNLLYVLLISPQNNSEKKILHTIKRLDLETLEEINTVNCKIELDSPFKIRTQNACFFLCERIKSSSFFHSDKSTIRGFKINDREVNQHSLIHIEEPVKDLEIKENYLLGTLSDARVIWNATSGKELVRFDSLPSYRRTQFGGYIWAPHVCLIPHGLAFIHIDNGLFKETVTVKTFQF